MRARLMLNSALQIVKPFSRAALRRYPVAGFAVIGLGLEFLCRDSGRGLALRSRRDGEDGGEGSGQQH